MVLCYGRLWLCEPASLLLVLAGILFCKFVHQAMIFFLSTPRARLRVLRLSSSSSERLPSAPSPSYAKRTKPIQPIPNKLRVIWTSAVFPNYLYDYFHGYYTSPIYPKDSQLSPVGGVVPKRKYIWGFACRLSLPLLRWSPDFLPVYMRC